MATTDFRVGVNGMSAEQGGPTGPDLASGIDLTEIADGAMLQGHVGDEAVLLARHGDEIFAIGTTCTHYGGPLAEGLMVGDKVHCPWHHACFSLRTGEALQAPALNPVPCWKVVQSDGKVRVTKKSERAPLEAASSPAPRKGEPPKSIGIIGAGAAGSACAEMLRRQGYDGPITMFDPDPAAPYDRPNLSKDYLAGNAPEEWIPLRPSDFYEKHGIELVREPVASLDAKAKRIALQNGKTRDFDRILLATGADPVKLQLPGSDLSHVHYLRSLADSRAIIAAAKQSKKAVVIGGSFIGLEVAASLRARELEVHVVAPETIPFEKILGRELGEFIRQLHEEKGVNFHLGRTAKSIAADSVTLDDGSTIAGVDLVVLGVGVRPRVKLAEDAGLEMDKGVSVSELLETSVPGVFAVGDIARWPDPHTGKNIRVEHWVVAQRQGQHAAKNLLGAAEPFAAVPFFWSQHYDTVVTYVGHAERWDRIDIQGSIPDRDCVLAYRDGKKTPAVAAIFRDVESLTAEQMMERGDWDGLREMLG
jgi:NADPH-dependent 2,4-dienoyl-CoA reductase/sulfur reductase-like enzyme/nitrite reductase/ring-hydroxylating ferredoxin subunit